MIRTGFGPSVDAVNCRVGCGHGDSSMRTKLLPVMASALTIALLVSPAGVRAQPDRATPSAAEGLVPAAEAPVPAQVTETTAPAPAAVTPVPAPTADAPPPKHEAETLPLFKAEQLDQLLAPLALYPDTLLAQILIAATYPLEVVKADRWLQDPSHLNLQGDQLAGAIEAEAWDPSVKSLVPFPRILRLMDENLEWTEQLGNAVLAQQADVMDSIQHLRHEAAAAGTLWSNPQQKVTTERQGIVIEPANPEFIYPPVCRPAGACDPRPCRQPQTGPASDAAHRPGGDLPATEHEQAGGGPQDLPLPAGWALDRAGQSGLVLGRHLHPDGQGLPLPGSDHGLGEPCRAGVAAVEHARRGVLCRGT